MATSPHPRHQFRWRSTSTSTGATSFLTLVPHGTTKSRGAARIHRQPSQRRRGSPQRQSEVPPGDVVTTVIKASNGGKHPYQPRYQPALLYRWASAYREPGQWMDVNQSIYLEGQPHRWEPAQPYLDRIRPPLWQKYASGCGRRHHGGMDWFLLNDFVESYKRGEKPPIDVYDAATWLVSRR